jgi:hypothetical protein
MNADLAVRRLSATVHQDPGSVQAGVEGGRARVERLLREVAETGLERGIRAAALPPGRWFIRRLDLPLVLELNRTDDELADQWARALTAAVQGGVRGRGCPVVCYADDIELLADAVAGIAAGHTERAWVWASAGLVRPGDPTPAAAPGRALLAMLHRRPQHAIAALARAVAVCGVPPLDRVLGRRGWLDLAAVIPGGAAAAKGAATLLAVGSTAEPGPARDPHGPGRAEVTAGDDGGARFPPAPAPAPVVPRAGVAGSQPAPPHLAQVQPVSPEPAAPGPASSWLTRPGLLGSLIAGSPLAAAFARARLRPDASTLAAWAALVVADADPASLHRAGSRELVAAIGYALATGQAPAYRAGRPRSGPRVTSRRAAPPEAGAMPSRDAATPSRGAATPSRPGAAPLPPGRIPHTNRSSTRGQVQDADPGQARSEAAGTATGSEGAFTAWAGAPFLLATAQAAGLPGRALDDLTFAGHTVRWVVHTVGLRLVPADAADPALLALAGVAAADGATLTAADPPTASEQKAIDELARDWTAVTAARFLAAQPASERAELAAPTSWKPAEVIARIGRRNGRVMGNRGWIEVHLPLAEVDIAVRRAGFDIDPGWVPWLGTVVRYVYE